jgi:DNA primase
MPPLASSDAVEQIKARLSLVEVVQRRVPLRRRQRDWWGLCPFHEEKTPSFKVNEQQQVWYCFGCQRSGDIFTFVQEIEKVDFRGALELLADLAGVELHDQSPADRRASERKRRILELNEVAAQYYAHVLHSMAAGEAGRSLLAERQVGEDTALRFGLGYAPGASNFAAFLRKRDRSIPAAQDAGLLRRDGQDWFQQRLIVPIRDERGRVLAFAGRTVRSDEPRKYVNTPESPVYTKGRVLFGLDLARPAIDERGHAVVMEGQFDVIVAHQYGVANAVASSGTALTPDQATLLKRYTDELILVFDNDRAGREATYRAIELAAGRQLQTRVVHLTGDAKDPDEFLRAGGDWEGLVRHARPGWEDWLRDAVEGLNPRRPEDVAVARRRAQAVLDRITDPALWTRYQELAKTMLDLDPRLDVFQAPERGRKRTEAPPDAPVSLSSLANGNNVSKSLAYLLSVLVVCPEAVDQVRALLDPADLEDDDRAAYLRMVEALQRGGTSVLERELQGFPSGEQQLVRRAWADPPPAVDALLAEDVARKIRRQADIRRRRAIINGLAEAERLGDTDRIAELEVQLRRLSARE